MPCRPLLRDLAASNRFVCQSCLYSLRRQAAQPAAASYSTRILRQTRRNARARTIEAGSQQPSLADMQAHVQGLEDLPKTTNVQGNADFSVRYFEQNGETRTELSEEQAAGESLAKFDGSELKQALFSIKDALATQEDKEAFQAVMREMGGAMDGPVSANDIEKMMARMQAYTQSLDAELEEAAADLPQQLVDELQQELSRISFDESLENTDTQSPTPSFPCPQIPEKPWTLNQRKKISRLNMALVRVAREQRSRSGLTAKGISQLYRAYHTARLALARAWSNVPVEVWDLLWDIFSADESVNTHRLSHVSVLARDMSEAKVTLNPAQQILTIEAMFVDGWETKAIESWKRCVGTLGDDGSNVFQDFWELGVRMYCRVGDVDQAERAINRLLARQLDPRILIPLIRTFAEQSMPQSQEKAWAAYRRMRDMLGKDMKLSDYDQVVSCFLTANQTENALYAFVDMMSDGKMDLKRQKYLPSVVANKFFLGKWLKRLIGAGDLDGALTVVEFMRKKGVNASPIHLNGLIGAWQRSGGALNLERADKLAWDMIESRIRFVRDRRVAKDNSDADATSSADSWPTATLETFSIMADNYRLRDLHDNMEALWAAFREAEISPDAFMMNQLLESHINAGRAKEAPDLYRSLVREQRVTPDPFTFSALWKTLAVNRLVKLPPEMRETEIAATRRLFEETVRFRHVFAQAGMDIQLARKILHTFRLLKDNDGFLVALTALRSVFAFLPPELLTLELLLGTSKLSWDTPAQRKRLRPGPVRVPAEEVLAARTAGGRAQGGARAGGSADGCVWIIGPSGSRYRVGSPDDLVHVPRALVIRLCII
ncbi:hypothetical protein HIM_08012 [Hirsutella minnesotensis 3608]|uniref:Pentacotripeptide-repeat region of PRORP domain-containing protein n=1 Tax=Hirsutella minnesotensis 3608 TaxID=1043627 RepID=A0A0F7ZT81_9HYPO|nr:hypothetical protein HIM_08012 [Hirsutella minnesotensis 3608]